MDACLVEPEPAPATASNTGDGPGLASVVRFACVAAVAAGVLWRLVRYVAGFPIWGDEAMTLLSVLDRDYAGLTQQLRFAQVAPLFFLWLEKTAILAFGTSEWSVHLVSFVASIGSLLIFWRICRITLTPQVASLALAIFAVSYYPVRHGCEAKPYALDLFFSMVLAWIALEQMRSVGSNRWLVVLTMVTPVAMFSSYPSVFVGGAVSLALLPTMRNATWTQRSLFVLFNLFLCIAFLAHYRLVGQQPDDAEAALRAWELRRSYWKDAFPPTNPIHWPFWILKSFTGNMLAYPIGANHGGSSATFALILIGSVVLWKANHRRLLAFCWLPFALSLTATLLDKYPFGDSARITLHLAPFICMLMALGLNGFIECIREPKWRMLCQVGLYAALFGLGVVGVARDLVKPFKTEHDREVRQLVRELEKRVQPGESVFLCHQREEELLAEFLWYLRTQPSFSVDWLPERGPSTESAWLLICGGVEPSTEAATASLPTGRWRVTESELRSLPPENSSLPTMHYRIVHIVRSRP